MKIITVTAKEGQLTGAQPAERRSAETGENGIPTSSMGELVVNIA